MYSLYYLARTGCCIVAILRKLNYIAVLDVLHAGRETDMMELIHPLVQHPLSKSAWMKMETKNTRSRVQHKSSPTETKWFVLKD